MLVRESYTYLTIDGQVCFHSFMALVMLENTFLGLCGPQGALIGLHGYQTAFNGSLDLPCGGHIILHQQVIYL